MVVSQRYRTWKTPLYALILGSVFFSIQGHSQYTDVINSNRPGETIGAFAVGTGIIQLESGVFYEQQDHSLFDTDSKIFGLGVALRYGLLFESLELFYEGIYQNQDITFNASGLEDQYSDFGRNRLGLKYLVYDPFKNPERNAPNLYSWRANNTFQWRNLIPAVSIYAGANFIFGDNPFFAPDEPSISPRVMVSTQSLLSPRFVLTTNIIYDRIGSDFPEWSYLVSLSHAFRNPRWSIFVENQGIKSDRYSDILLRTGVAYLLNENFQADILIGGSFKDTPSRGFIAGGISYRIDRHVDKLKPIEDQEPKIGRKDMRKKKKESGKSDKKKGEDPEKKSSESEG